MIFPVRFLIVLLGLLALMPSAFAAKTFRVSAPDWFSDLILSSPSCSSLSPFFPAHWGTPSCDGFGEAVKSGYGTFTISVGGQQKVATIRVHSGMCVAGQSAGRFTAPGGYVRSSDGEVVQNFPDPAPFSHKGCMVAGKGDFSCTTDGAEVAPGIKLGMCSQEYEETGQDGGEDDFGPDQTKPPYNGNGGGNTGGGNTGGGNTGGGNTGGGNTGGGETGGGNTGGGNTGGGNTGGGNTGGGNTGGGNTGGGNTGGGGDGSGTGDLCTKHPNLNICKNSTWGGNCGDITCNGDAIQCETLRLAAIQRCERREELDILGRMKERQLGEQILGGNDPDKDRLPSKANAEQIELPKLDTTGWLGGGSCFADKAVSVMGSTVNIPFSQVCSYLVVLRYALMVCALLISFKVLSGAILRE